MFGLFQKQLEKMADGANEKDASNLLNKIIVPMIKKQMPKARGLMNDFFNEDEKIIIIRKPKGAPEAQVYIFENENIEIRHTGETIEEKRINYEKSKLYNRGVSVFIMEFLTGKLFDSVGKKEEPKRDENKVSEKVK